MKRSAISHQVPELLQYRSGDKRGYFHFFWTLDAGVDAQPMLWTHLRGIICHVGNEDDPRGRNVIQRGTQHRTGTSVMMSVVLDHVGHSGRVVHTCASCLEACVGFISESDAKTSGRTVQEYHC